MRISGLASGMDVDSMVQQLMKANRVPLDKLNQKKQTLEWKRDSYRTINSQLVDFRNNKLTAYRKSDALNVFKAEVSGDDKAISVKATTNANRVPMEVKVESLATQFTYGGETPVAANANAKMTLDQLQPGGPDKYTLSVSRGPNDPNKVDFEFSKNESIGSVIRKINSELKANVTASFDEATGKFSIASNEYGSKALQLDGSDFLNAMKIDPTKPSGGDKAKATINGNPMEFNSNKNTINGVEITFLAPSKQGEVSKITTKTDSDKIFETITSFIKDYNSVLDALNKKVDEQRYRDYTPLTDEQKKAMKEDEVKLWNEKAQSGLLKNDEILRSAIASLRQPVVTASVTGSTMKLSGIGITTGEWFEGGKLSISDPDKLRKAIEEHPDEVIELFTGTGVSSPSQPKGFFNDLYDGLDKPLKMLADRAGTNRYSADISVKFNEQSIMGKELTSLKDNIKVMTKKLTEMEKKYYTQFNAMETAMNKLNSQSASLANFGMK